MDNAKVEKHVFATITREKVYGRPSPGGAAWGYVYTIMIPSSPACVAQNGFTGKGLDWAKGIAKRHGATKIVETWKS